MKLTLKIWRQAGPKAKGQMVDYPVDGISEDMSFLEMLDVLNDKLILEGQEPIAFDHDCREGICGACSLFIDGRPHGPGRHITTCQLHMRRFKDGDVIHVEPWRAKAFPVIKDLVVDRSAFDRIQQAGGFVSVNTNGNLVDANAIPVPKADADKAFDAATCIGCGACVAACPNSSAMLFVSAKVSQFALLPQGRAEAKERALNMVDQMDAEKFGNCSNIGACEIECPKDISLENIARLNREYLGAAVSKEEGPPVPFHKPKQA
ncbi:MAG: succinate dehydrogenase/fumarate reductase iron-sulfur subunit [Flavobacteriales bacterium]|nr:succinate dehydrogenase/fumarate reductase iron-sulfur subunit [Flavobacteriales bacterium]